MTRRIAITLAVVALAATPFAGCKKQEPQKAETPAAAPAQPAPAAAPEAAPAAAPSGEALFKQHCAVCHPDGGNIVKAEFTLHGKALAAHKIATPEDIVAKMRNPGPGMTKFDTATISDADATAIAEYVLKAFK